MMLTTVDNPFNPFTHYDEWAAWDAEQGYHTPSLLGRVVRSSDELSEADQEFAIDEAMKEIARENVSGMHRLVSETSE